MDRRKFLGVGLAAFVAIVAPGTDLRAVDFRKTKPKAWEVEKTVDGIKALYGNGELKTSKKLSFKAPKLAENGGSIPITIKSSLDLESVALFQDANPRCLTCVFSVPEGAIIDYDFRIKLRQTAVVTVVGKERGTGNLYTASKEIDVSIGGCGG
ncbi:sulfur oxidation protein SoxYZ [Sulfurimonas hongkongensis]|uniref:Sulfur oxidation protein SoxYZ n=1 Tax=Sulfurimonas hongkongensis TaxID=1172190 RepID=T0L0X7_9BACT|nr:thiosulfate oxidation carrier protein SoxY [Sulfurimonas hongkongensis]EQB39428.1 sulfur oxidation protein SoxYZ [Sulfurimonas hongkongensis]